MSKYWRSQNKVKCPFYLGERDRCIVCMGTICEKVQWQFESPQAKHEYQEACCYNNMDECVHYNLSK